MSSNPMLGIVLRCAASAGALSSAGSMVSMSLFGSAQGTERERLKETTSKLRVWLHGVVSSGGFKVRMAVWGGGFPPWAVLGSLYSAGDL